jgi:hypothetical protein
MSDKNTIEEQRDLLERRANAVRSRLLLAVDALDARRQRVEQIGARAKDLAVPALLSVAGVIAAASAVGFGISYYLFSRRHRRISERLKDGVRSLDLVRPPSLGRRLLERTALTVMSVLVTTLAKRAASRFVRDRRVPLLTSHEPKIVVREGTAGVVVP